MTTVASYLPEVECEVTVPEGMLDTSVISVSDDDDKKQFLRVGRGEVVAAIGKTYLPIWVVQIDIQGQRALVELPQEADSGTKRLWVPLLRFRPA